MPIKTTKTDLEWGDIFYLKVDPLQNEYHLVGIVTSPSPHLQFQLARFGEEIIVWEFECSKTIDELKALKAREDGEGGDIIP